MNKFIYEPREITVKEELFPPVSPQMNLIDVSTREMCADSQSNPGAVSINNAICYFA